MKEKINNFFTGKFLPILIIFLLFLFNMCISSFAVTNEVKFTDCFKEERTIILNKDLCNFKYYSLFVFTQKDVPYNLIGFIGSDYEMSLNIDKADLYFIDGQSHDIYYKISNPLTAPTDVEDFISKLNNYNISNLGLLNQKSIGGTFLSSSGTQCVFASYDLKDSEGNLVFQAPVPAVVAIPGLETVEEVPQAMSQVMRVLVPIGLIIFGIGLVIFLIRLLIWRVQ